MTPQDITYALAKQVPAMERGFTIGTSYGDIVIEAGWVASIVITHLERALRAELRELELALPQDGRDRHGFSSDTALIGTDHVRHPFGGPIDPYRGQPDTSPESSALLTSQVARLQKTVQSLACQQCTLGEPGGRCQSAPLPAVSPAPERGPQ